MLIFSRTFVAFIIAAALSGAVNLPANAEDNSNFSAFFGGSETNVSNEDLLAALEEAADAGQPIALWRLGVMYENGEGVQQDKTKAFLYFRELADGHADTPPKSVGADIVAQSFLKVGDYYREGVPDAGVKADDNLSRKLWLHAASYFGDADAQFKVGQLYLDEGEFGYSPKQSARWLALASRKGHPAAQATLGDLMFNGEGIQADPIEGLMWLTLASRQSGGTDDGYWISELYERAVSVATPDERQKALQAADTLGGRFGG